MKTSKAILEAILDALAGRNGFALSARARKGLAISAVLVLFGIAVILGAWLTGQSLTTPPEGSAAWDAVLAGRVAAARVWWVILATLTTLAESYVIFSAFDRTPLGKRLWCWSSKDTDMSKSAKTLAAGLGFIGLLAVLAILNSKVLP